MSQNHIIVKFFSSEAYAKDFLDGKLYMNSLHNFWNEYPNKRNLSPSQEDLLEGTVGSIKIDSPDKKFSDAMLSDAILRSVGFGYCNIMCFYKLRYKQRHKRNHIVIDYSIPQMAECGNYVVIIKNKAKFQNRIKKSFVNLQAKFTAKFLCGDVIYKKLEKRGESIDISNKHHLLLETGNPIVLPLENISTYTDCFTKLDKYKNQNEWRIAVYRGIQSTDAYIHEIEDLHDISVFTTANNMVSEIDKLFYNNEVYKSPNEDFGNTNREELQKLLHTLGDNKCKILTFIG